MLEPTQPASLPGTSQGGLVHVAPPSRGTVAAQIYADLREQAASVLESIHLHADEGNLTPESRYPLLYQRWQLEAQISSELASATQELISRAELSAQPATSRAPKFNEDPDQFSGAEMAKVGMDLSQRWTSFADSVALAANEGRAIHDGFSKQAASVIRSINAHADMGELLDEDKSSLLLGHSRLMQANAELRSPNWRPSSRRVDTQALTELWPKLSERVADKASRGQAVLVARNASIGPVVWQRGWSGISREPSEAGHAQHDHQETPSYTGPSFMLLQARRLVGTDEYTRSVVRTNEDLTKGPGDSSGR